MKSILSLTFIVVATVFFSCSKKQDNNVPPTLSAISITGVHEADTLKGTLSAQVVVSGSTQPTKIEVYANDSLITTVNNALYNLKWNTLGVNNGNYKIRVVAYDSAGKQVQTTLNVIVHNILITLEIDPKIYEQFYTNVIYIVTDSNGTVLNSLKYNGTDKNIEIAGTHASLNSRCSAFEVRTGKGNSLTEITGYMSIPKGSIWDLRRPLNPTNPSYTATNLTFSNLPYFNRLTLSSDVYGLSYTNPQNIYPSNGYAFTPTGKLFVQYVYGNDNGYYSFINIDTTQPNSTIDLAVNTYKPSLKNTVTINGASVVYPSIYGKYDQGYDSYYLLDNPVFLTSKAEYFYPDSGFTQLKSSVFYGYNNMDCISTYLGLPPQTIIPFNASATIANNTLTNFNFTSQGDVDYYRAFFQNASLDKTIAIFAPSTYHSFQFPDILKLANLSNMNPGDFKPYSFIMFKTPGFNESRLLSYYLPWSFSQLSLPSQSATLYFH